MLSKLYADNYRGMVDLTLDFKEISLLLGPNGSGKSSVVDLLHALRELLTGRAVLTDAAMFPTDSVTKWTGRSLQVFRLSIELDSGGMEYRLEVEHESRRRLARILLEELSSNEGKPLFRFERGNVQLFRDDHSSGSTYTANWSESALARVAPTNENTRLTSFLDFIRRITICRLQPSRFLTEANGDDETLDRDGSNFASWYHYKVAERSSGYENLRLALSNIMPGLSSVGLTKVGARSSAFVCTFLDPDSKSYPLFLDQVSDGQRCLLALYSLLSFADGNEVLVLDEPESHIALAEIQPWLMSLKDGLGEGVRQAVLCSHHPELIDYLGGECGILLNREQSGRTTARALAEIVEASGPLRLSEIIARGWEAS